MLEDFFALPAVQRLRSCVFGTHLEAYCAGLVASGYRRATIRKKLGVVGQLARWVVRKHLAVGDLDERRVGDFLDARRRRGLCCRAHGSAALLLLWQLRSAGVVPGPVPVPPTGEDSPVVGLLARYEDYLRRERGLAEGTIASYLPFARAFAIEHVRGKGAHPASLRPDDIRDFLLDRVRRMSPRRPQAMGIALRSFLRFLFLRGETGTDLSLTIPTVRRWRLSHVPRHIPARDVERVLRTCDRSSAAGWRDHAILLLLARLGLRPSEVTTLELDDLRWRAGEIVVRGKGLLRDRLPLPSDVGNALALYLQKDRPTGGSRRVFVCRRAPHRGFARPSTVTRIARFALAQAGLAPATGGAYLFRHSLAVAMLGHGASLSEIGQLFRHRKAATTEIYAKVDFGALREVAMPWPTRGARR